jgi:hypothetical protein
VSWSTRLDLLGIAEPVDQTPFVAGSPQSILPAANALTDVSTKARSIRLPGRSERCDYTGSGPLVELDDVRGLPEWRDPSGSSHPCSGVKVSSSQSHESTRSINPRIDRQELLPCSIECQDLRKLSDLGCSGDPQWSQYSDERRPCERPLEQANPVKRGDGDKLAVCAHAEHTEIAIVHVHLRPGDEPAWICESVRGSRGDEQPVPFVAERMDFRERRRERALIPRSGRERPRAGLAQPRDRLFPVSRPPCGTARESSGVSRQGEREWTTSALEVLAPRLSESTRAIPSTWRTSACPPGTGLTTSPPSTTRDQMRRVLAGCGSQNLRRRSSPGRTSRCRCTPVAGGSISLSGRPPHSLV